MYSCTEADEPLRFRQRKCTLSCTCMSEIVQSCDPLAIPLASLQERFNLLIPTRHHTQSARRRFAQGRARAAAGAGGGRTTSRIYSSGNAMAPRECHRTAHSSETTGRSFRLLLAPLASILVSSSTSSASFALAACLAMASCAMD